MAEAQLKSMSLLPLCFFLCVRFVPVALAFAASATVAAAAAGYTRL